MQDNTNKWVLYFYNPYIHRVSEKYNPAVLIKKATDDSSAKYKST